MFPSLRSYNSSLNSIFLNLLNWIKIIEGHPSTLWMFYFYSRWFYFESLSRKLRTSVIFECIFSLSLSRTHWSCLLRTYLSLFDKDISGDTLSPPYLSYQSLILFSCVPAFTHQRPTHIIYNTPDHSHFSIESSIHHLKFLSDLLYPSFCLY